MPLLALLCRQDPFHRELEDYISHVEVLKGENLGNYHEKPIAQRSKNYLTPFAAVENRRVVSEVVPTCKALQS